jgi:hypothetical protein
VSWDFDNPPPGYRVEWAPDTHWTTDPAVIAGRGCRFTGGPRQKVCGKPAVAALNRRYHRAGAKPSWWCYCGEHLYGRRIRDGVVEAQRLVSLQEGE